MPVLVRRAVLDALIHPKFQAELPEELRDHVKFIVAQAVQGSGAIELGYSAKAVREAAQRLRTKPGVPKKLAEALLELTRIPGY
ncbi:MAG TPA: hypothetical protein VNX67_06740 [Solirubrobacteraceae bacterium]|jgi:hypothetical protein|nr:hypothetical protein [Solirubrobacteraceae bacterium]